MPTSTDAIVLDRSRVASLIANEAKHAQHTSQTARTRSAELHALGCRQKLLSETPGRILLDTEAPASRPVDCCNRLVSNGCTGCFQACCGKV